MKKVIVNLVFAVLYGVMAFVILRLDGASDTIPLKVFGFLISTALMALSFSKMENDLIKYKNQKQDKDV